jgi:hypothetical protein
VIAQVLELGTFEDGQRLRQSLGDGRLAQVLQRAEPGWLSPRSWTYWAAETRPSHPGHALSGNKNGDPKVAVFMPARIRSRLRLRHP